jgi:hypothetical protein
VSPPPVPPDPLLMVTLPPPGDEMSSAPQPASASALSEATMNKLNFLLAILQSPAEAPKSTHAKRSTEATPDLSPAAKVVLRRPA